MATEVSVRARVGRWVESSAVQRTIVALILINAATLGLETSSQVMAIAGSALHIADRALLAVFVMEILLKLYALGARFFRNPWHVFDFLVVGIALVPSSGPLTVLRVLRLLRLVSMVPRLRFVVEALLRAVPGILSIVGLLGLLYYVFAVMATGLFGESFPEWFGTIARSMYTLFQIMTLESWSMGIVRPVMTEFPYAWLFFVPFILVATFTILNLFIAIIVSTMQSLAEEERREEHTIIEEVVHDESVLLRDELRAVRTEIGELKAALAARK